VKRLFFMSLAASSAVMGVDSGSTPPSIIAILKISNHLKNQAQSALAGDPRASGKNLPSEGYPALGFAMGFS